MWIIIRRLQVSPVKDVTTFRGDGHIFCDDNRRYSYTEALRLGPKLLGVIYGRAQRNTP
jgi:hypothetical protein